MKKMTKSTFASLLGLFESLPTFHFSTTFFTIGLDHQGKRHPYFRPLVDTHSFINNSKHLLSFINSFKDKLYSEKNPYHKILHIGTKTHLWYIKIYSYII